MSNTRIPGLESLRRLLEEAASLPPDELEEAARSLEKPRDTELAAVYAAVFLRLAQRWLRWEEKCHDHHGSLDEECLQMLREARLQGASGPSFQANRSLKSLVAKMYAELSPGIGVPYWVVAYDPGPGGGDEKPLIRRLAELTAAEQVARVPTFAALVAVLDAAARGLLARYSGRSEFAETTAEYIYWEIVRPCSMFYDAACEVIGGCSAHSGLLDEIRERYMADGERPAAEVRAAIEEIAGSLAARLRERLALERMKRQRRES